MEDATHRSLALWAAACAEHVLELFEDQHPDDERPRAAIEAARRWAREQIPMSSSRQGAPAAHAAARESTGAAAAVARAAGHAAATAHMADHELGPAYYALRAVALATDDPAAVERERRWQVDHLPDDIRELVLDDMHRRAKKFNGAFGR